jgi:uncharacterized protein YqgC (DUF456 family)
MDMTWLAWTGVIMLLLVGVAGTVLPALPGTVLVFAGVLLGAWLDDFTRVTPWVVVLCGVLSALAWATDFVAGMLGAKRVAASGWALVGATVGTVAGVFTGFIGLLFMPLAGAMAGELWAQYRKVVLAPHRDNAKRAVEVGVATWLGLLIGTAVKLALVLATVGVFAVAYFF